MKRTFACFVIICLLVACASGCTPKGVQPFSVQAGAQVFCQIADNKLPVTELRRVNLPNGVRFIADLGEMGVQVAREQEDGTLRYGLWRGDEEVLACAYTRLMRYGQYLFTQSYGKEDVYLDVRNAEGKVIVGSTDTSAHMQALGDYFVLYTDTQAQMFDAEGNECFPDGVLSPTEGLSICDDYVLSADVATNTYRVWQLFKSERGITPFLCHQFHEADMRYSVSYLSGRFLVTAIGESTPQDYTFIEVLDGISHYMRQQVWWYDAAKDALSPTKLDYVPLSVKNAYTPGISQSEVEDMHLQAGYSAVAVAECNSYNVHETDRYYVIDAQARRLVRYPSGLNPTAIYYRDNMGFAGSAAGDGAALLYDLAGNLVWQRKDHTYGTMSWQSGRFVASYVQDGITRYGAFDDKGNVAIPFAYDYMSPFYEGKCIARQGEDFFLLNDAGARVAVVQVAGSRLWLTYGVYAFREDGKMGIRNLAESVVIPAQWSDIDSVGQTYDGHIYVVAVAADGGRTQIILQ